MKVEHYLAQQQHEHEEDIEPKENAPELERPRRSISITVQSIELPADERPRSPLENELCQQDTLPCLKKANTIRRTSDTTLDTDMLMEEEDLRPRIYSTNTQKHSKGKSSLIDAGRNSVFSEVNDLRQIDKGRRTSARIRQLECDMKSELTSIRYDKSKRLDLPPRPNGSKIGIEYETVDATGINSRRKLLVSCSN